MREAIITLLEIVAGPIVLLIVLPVIPTFFICVGYPLFVRFLNWITKKFTERCWPFWARVGLFYIMIVLSFMRYILNNRDIIEHPSKLYPLLQSRGFRILFIYTILVTVFHKHLERISNHPKVQQLKKQALSIILTLFSKITRA